MKTQSYEDIQMALQETRENLEQWVAATPHAKRQIQLGLEDESCIEEHLHVINESLEKIEEGTFGICEVCHDEMDSELLQMDYTAAVCLGHFTDQELRQLENELELSQVIQRGLLPQQVPDIAGMNIAAFSRPAQILGGDYFDFIDFKDNTHGLVIADVSGHGVSAGMFMSSLQTAFHTLVPDATSPLEVLERINRLYVHNVNVTTFVTIFFGQYDSQTRILTYANAGHNSAYLYRKSTNEEIWLRPSGPAIGLMERFLIQKREVQLQPGDILMLYTDGFTEATDQDGTFWSEDGLATIIRQNAEASAEQLIQKILQALKEHTNGHPLEDDVTLVMAKVS
jgi:sigma-B regulation protein RsbU (phosphoserine phosphatase)